MRTGYVYLIGDEAGGPIKIGHATNVKQRLSTLQVGTWHPLSILHTATVIWTMAPAVERAVQDQFEGQRVRGEWFNVPLLVLQNSLDSVAASYARMRSEGDGFSKDIAIALCKSPERTMGVLSAYRNRANDLTSKAFIAALNRTLLEQAGQASYLMFQMVFIENRDMTNRFRNDAYLARQAEASLVKAMDVLTDIWPTAVARWQMGLDVSARTAA